MEKFEKENLPVINIKQLESLFADLILWYDKDYCKTKEGAYEVIGEYMTSDGRNDVPSESGLNIVSDAVCHYWHCLDQYKEKCTNGRYWKTCKNRQTER